MALAATKIITSAYIIHKVDHPGTRRGD